MLRRFVKVVYAFAAAMASAPSYSQGQSSETLAFPPDIVGGAQIADINGAGKCPLKLDFIATATNTNNCRYEIYQTHTYIPSAKTFVAYSANVTEATWQSTSGLQRLFFPFNDWWTWRNTNVNTMQRQFGKFYCQLVVSNVVKKRWDWEIKPEDIDAFGSYSQGSGGQITPGGVGTGSNSPRPSDTGGFWSNLFVPSEAAVEGLVDSLERFQNWGPFGILNALGSSPWDMEGYSGPMLGSQIQFTLPMVGTQTIDCTPYEAYIKMFRMLMAGSMWFTIILNIYKRLYGSTGSNDN